MKNLIKYYKIFIIIYIMSQFIYNNYLIGGAQPLIVNQKYNLLTSTSSPDTNIDADGELDNGKAFQNITITKIVPNKYLKHLTEFTLKDPNNQAKSIQHDSRHNHYKLKTSGGKVNIVQIKDSNNKNIYVAPIVDAVLKAKQEIDRKNNRKFVEQMRNKAIAQQNALAQQKADALAAKQAAAKQAAAQQAALAQQKADALAAKQAAAKQAAAKQAAAQQAALAQQKADALAAKQAAAKKNTLIAEHENIHYKKKSKKPTLHAKVHNLNKHNKHQKHSPKQSHHKPHHGKPHHKPHHGKPHHQKPQPQSQFTSYVYQADPEAEAKAAREEAIRRDKARQKHKNVSYTYHR